MIIKIIILLILIGFFFVDLKSNGYLHNFIITFIFAIPYSIKDFILLNKKEFRGYGFHLYCGLGGSGKTLSIVNYLLLLRRKYPKLKIYTNFYFTEGDGIIKNWSDLINITNYETIEIDESEYKRLCFLKPRKEEKEFYKKEVECLNEETGEIQKIFKYYKIINHGVVFGFDEIHMTLSSDNWKSRPDDLLYYISQQRKMHKQIVASSQVFTRIDKTLREQTNFVVDCKSFLMGRLCSNKYYYTEEYLANDEKKDKGPRKRKFKKYRIFIAVDKIRNAYDTEEIMKELKLGKSKESQLTDLLIDALKSKEN